MFFPSVGDFYQPEKCLTNNSHTYRDGEEAREREAHLLLLFQVFHQIDLIFGAFEK